MNLKWIKIIPIFLVLALVVVVYLIFFNVKNPDDIPDENDEGNTSIKTKLEILDLESNSRPIAVMINNHKEAQPYQAGLNDAYLVYEMVVEGGITRMLALFKDAETSKVGPVRSSRPYYLDYALENGAIYTHFGGSPQAYSDIESLNIANVDGMNDAGFWRDEYLIDIIAYEHTAFTNIENILKIANQKKYNLDSTKDILLNYNINDIDLSKIDGAIKADNVYIEYSDYQKNTFKYDPITKTYNKYSNGELRKDYVTGEAFEAKNIITYQVNNYSVDSYGRQELENIGSGNGYLISNGYAVPITWEKDSRTSQTVYKFLNGEEITVNDGITYIQIQPENKKIEIS